MAIRRILLILHSAAVGGMETHCIDLAAEYIRRGIVVKALVPEWSEFDEVDERFRRVGAHVERLDTDAREGRFAQVRRWPRLMRICRRFAPDVVHLQTPGATGGLATLLLARISAPHATVVITEHDVPWENPRGWTHIARLLIDRVAHATVAVSRRNARLRTERLRSAPRRFAAILNGVPLPNEASDKRAANRQRVRREMGLPEDGLVIGSLVRLALGKGLDDLIRGFATVVEHQEADLLLVGDGPLRADLERLAQELGIAQYVHFAGHHEKPTPFLDAMDVFVLAVPAGSMSIALLEAMSRGLPPVITFCGPEEAVINEESGLCAPPNDPPGLGAVLLRIASDCQLRTSLGPAAGQHVERHFSVRRVADDLLEVYACAGAGRPLSTRLRADGPPNPRPGDAR